MEESKDFNGLRETLKTLHWPGFFMFKFIVPAEKAEEIFNICPSPSVSTRHSRTGKYVGITSHIFMASEEEVINIYKQASKVDGVILL